jgi:hypothetical protein
MLQIVLQLPTILTYVIASITSRPAPRNNQFRFGIEERLMHSPSTWLRSMTKPLGDSIRHTVPPLFSNSHPAHIVAPIESNAKDFERRWSDDDGIDSSE